MTDARVGILGVGGFGLFTLEQYRQMPGIRITAIAGTHPEKYARLAATYGIPFHTTDWRALVTHPEVDIVYIATPPYLHAEQALAAMAAGKHVFCEKPLALHLDEADAMLDAAARHGTRVGINFVMRYSAGYRLLQDITSTGSLGAPLRFLFSNAAGDLPASHWFWDARLSGGIPVEHGVHFFDIFRAIFGPGTLRWAGSNHRGSGEEDKWLAVLQYEGSVLGSFYHAFDMPSVLERTWAMIEYERGRIGIEGWIPERVRLDGVVTAAAVEALAALTPVEATPLAETGETMRANGQAFSVTHHVRADVGLGEKSAIYAEAVRAALADFVAWVADPAHEPRVTGEDARAALHMAREVTAFAHRT